MAAWYGSLHVCSHLRAPNPGRYTGRLCRGYLVDVINGMRDVRVDRHALQCVGKLEWDMRRGGGSMVMNWRLMETGAET